MPGGGKGGGSSTVTVNNGPITVDSDSTVDIQGLDDIKVAAKIDPIEIQSRQELVIPEPIRTQSQSDSKSDITSTSTSDNRSALAVDLKPVVLDVCSTTTTNLPHGEILQPFNYHFGLTWFGVEVLGFSLKGDSRTILRDLPKKPAVDWPAQQNSSRRPPPPCDEPSAMSSRGLRVRVKQGP